MNEQYLKMFNEMNNSLDFKSNRFNSEDVEEFSFNNEKESTEKQKSNSSVPIDETIHFKRYSVRRERNYTEKEMTEIKSKCQNTIVNDYGTNDFYHISDEERQKNDNLAEIAMKLASVKSLYRRLDQYIEAMRIVYKAWELLSEQNVVHSKKEFFKMVAKGEIISHRIIIPQLKNIKKYNMDLIIRYISNPELDVSVFAPKNDYEEYIEEEDFEEQMFRMLSPEDIAYIQERHEHPEQVEQMKVNELPNKLMKNYLQPKSNKKTNLHQQTFNKIVDATRKIGSNGSQTIFGSSLFDLKKDKSVYDKIEFKSSWRKSKDADFFNMLIDEAILDEPANRYKSKADLKMNEFYNELDRAGINWRQSVSYLSNLTPFNQEQDENKIKENKKIEKSILKRIAEMNKNPKFIDLVKKAENRLTEYMEKGENIIDD